MKKGLSLILILLLVVTALAGCSGGNETTTTNEQENTNVESNEKEATTEEKTEEPAEEIVYKDGVYEGTGEGMHTIKVSVEVAGGKISKVEILEHEETEGIAEPAIEQIPVAIVEKNTPNVDVVSGATLASEGIIDAVNNALEAAK